MEDTAVIMRVNALARELRAHNPELGRDEAALQAERMITGKTGEFVSAARPPEETPERRDIENELIVLTNRLNNVMMELSTLKASYAELQQQFRMLSDEFAFVKNRTNNIRAERAEESTDVPKKQEKQITFEKARPLNYTEADVSVEKIFYFGKK